MAADIFETYAVTIVASMFLGALFGVHNAVVLPLLLGALAIPASIVGTLMVRLPKSGSIMTALYTGVFVSAILSAILFYPVVHSVAGGLPESGNRIYLCALTGLVITALLVGITEYYTGTRFNPVKRIAQQSTTGHATNIIAGLAVGMQATALPVIVLVIGTLVSFKLAGVYGIATAVTAMLSMAGMVVALDAFGPITDNAGGIAEMADLPHEVRDNVTDPLDAVGNTTKAVTKGYALAPRHLQDQRDPQRELDVAPVVVEVLVVRVELGRAVVTGGLLIRRGLQRLGWRFELRAGEACPPTLDGLSRAIF